MEVVHPVTHSAMLTTAAAAVGLMCVSCGGTAEGLSSVRGKVVCNGQPAAGAMLFFHRQPGQPAPARSAANIIPSALVAEDGGFTVESHPLGSGAAPGKYSILVQWSEERDPVEVRAARRSKARSTKGRTVTFTKSHKLDSLAPDRLKGRYSDLSRPLREVEVKPGPNDLGALELEMKN
jgi:hypothetical protein